MSSRLLALAPLLIFLGMVIGLSVSVVSSVGLTIQALRVDYIALLTGGTLWSEGHRRAAELYDLAIQASVQQRILAGRVRLMDGLLPFIHPPYVAALCSLVAGFSPAWAFVLWDLGHLAVLTLSVYLLHPLVPPSQRHLIWVGAFAFFPVHQSLLEGQISPLVLLSIVLMWRCLRRGGAADWWAGVSLGIALIKPHLAAPFALYLLYERNWRALAAFAASGAGLYLLTAAASGVDWPLVYMRTVNWISAQHTRYGALPNVMLNWRGLLLRFDVDSTAALGILTAGTVGALVYALWRSADMPADANGRVGARELRLAATTSATTLASVHLYLHDLTVLVFTGAVLLGWGLQAGWPTWLTALLVANLLAPLLLFAGQPVDGVFVLTMALAFAAIVHLLLAPRSAPLLRGGVPTADQPPIGSES